MRRPRLRRPQARSVATSLAVLGVAVAAAILLVPVQVAFADDPLLRLGRFTGADTGATDIECGAPVGNLLRRSEDLSFYRVAADDACRRASSRRAATAVASGSVIVLLGLVGATAATGRGRT